MRHADNVHSLSETERTLQDDRMFALVHSEQEEGWRPEGAAIAMQDSRFSAQREQEDIISPSEIMVDTSSARRSEAVDLMGGIRQGGYQIDLDNATPLINDLEMDDIFEDEDEEEEDGVTDQEELLSQILESIRLSSLSGLVDSMEPVEPWDEG